MSTPDVGTIVYGILPPMPISDILSLIDQEIDRLNEARSLLSNLPTDGEPTKRRGRPAGSETPTKATRKGKAKRPMSAEGRAKIAEAQRRRHAAAKRLTSGE